MRDRVKELNEHLVDAKVVACCCGHGVYPPTIVVKYEGSDYPVELLSNKTIPRVRRFYKRDKQGIYFVPEAVRTA